jgi:hypothetical protein
MPAENSPPAPPFVCPLCGWKSYNPNDAEQQYCGHCHRFIAAELERLRLLEAWRERYAKKQEN